MRLKISEIDFFAPPNMNRIIGRNESILASPGCFSSFRIEHCNIRCPIVLANKKKISMKASMCQHFFGCSYHLLCVCLPCALCENGKSMRRPTQRRWIFSDFEKISFKCPKHIYVSSPLSSIEQYPIDILRAIIFVFLLFIPFFRFLDKDHKFMT